ncbi:MAG TPA: hypothetical protein VK783_10410 [Bacteroidia bacterium]|jgi:hypothetical protein|nr:hypothetical protein [Bacteroidia bacterium]
MENQHKFITQTVKPKQGMIPEAGLNLTNYYLNGNKGIGLENWKKEKRDFTVKWFNKAEIPQESKKINYRIICDHIRETGTFSTQFFNLPTIECLWMDHSLDMKIDFHHSDHLGETLGLASGIPQQQYGEKYPIKPLLKREGNLYTSFQPQLMARVMRERLNLIENSDKALEDEWVFQLRTLISDTISLLDITLNQVYIKAEYDPLPGWKFDKNKIGERHGRRLNDKLKWVFQITGTPINIEPEQASLEALKELRNHLMHFDPPSLVVTIEEAAIWLNQLIDIAMILVKIRKALKVEVSTSLINLILQKEVQFIPKHTQTKRQPLNNLSQEDYSSTRWPQ